MADWYRRKTWTKMDEEEFFAKLGRARVYNRPQYLRVQAIELIETRNNSELEAAEKLLSIILRDYPENKFEKSPAFNSLGEIYKVREDYEKALDYFKQTLDFEKEYSKVQTNAFLNFAETVVQAQKTELYDEVEKLLTAKLNERTLIFPVQNYIIYSVLSIISAYRNDDEKAKVYADLADKFATSETNSLWNPYKKHIGIVKKRKTWLDKLVKRK